MKQPGKLQFDNKVFDFEKTSVYGIFEPHGNVTWHIELFPPGEENYIMFNSLILPGIFSPERLTGTAYNSNTDAGDLYEHTVVVNGQDRFLQSVDMTFGKWDTEDQSIELTGQGVIEQDGDLPEVTYSFKTWLYFEGINIFSTTSEEVQKFVDTYLQESKDRLSIDFENVASGLTAVIGGRF